MPSGTAVSQGISLWLIRESRGTGGGFSPAQREVKHMEGRCEASIWQRNEKEITAGRENVNLLPGTGEFLTVRRKIWISVPSEFRSFRCWNFVGFFPGLF